MKRTIMVMVLICCMVALSACGSRTETDHPAAIMVNDQIYYWSVQAIPAEQDIFNVGLYEKISIL